LLLCVTCHCVIPFLLSDASICLYLYVHLSVEVTYLPHLGLRLLPLCLGLALAYLSVYCLSLCLCLKNAVTTSLMIEE